MHEQKASQLKAPAVGRHPAGVGGAAARQVHVIKVFAVYFLCF